MSTNILLYTINFSLSLALFWLVYRIFIKRAKNIVFNRFYLLTALLFSLLVPTIKVCVPFTSPQEIISHKWLSNSDNDNSIFASNMLLLEQEKIESSVNTPPNIKLDENEIAAVPADRWNIFLKWMYLLVGTIFIFHLILQIFRTIGVILKSERKKVNDVSLCLNQKVKHPYSFLWYIIINPDYYSSEEYQQIIAHETEHCKQLHFFDSFLLEILKPLFWFIPFVWVYEHEIKENHEYLADYGVIKWGFNKQLYLQTLLKGSLGMHYLGIASFLHKSFIKKRIVMMTNLNTKKMPLWKIALLVPIVVIGLSAFSNKTSSSKVSVNDVNISSDNAETLELNKVYQFISRINGNFFCRGTFTFYGIDDKDIWHGSQNNFTQYSDISVTAKVSDGQIEIYTGKPWNETWKVTSIENGVYKGQMTGEYSLAQNTEITFELKEHVNISELMPNYRPKSEDLIAKSIPFIKDEKYYWELWDKKTQTSTLSGWFSFKTYNSETKTISGIQYNYRTKGHTDFTATYANNIVTITIGEPWNEVWTGEIIDNMYIGEQTFNHNAKYFKGNGARGWRMSTKPFEDRLKVFAELKNK